MGYSMIFETRIVTLSDGRILHLDLSGCNNDEEGRRRDDFKGKIYASKDEFIHYAESFKKDSKPMKESEYFDLKIIGRNATWFDYGKHLLFSLKRALTWEELITSRFVSVYYVASIDVEKPKKMHLTLKEFDQIYWDLVKEGSLQYKINYNYLSVKNEVNITNALDKGISLIFRVDKPYKCRMGNKK